MLLLSEGHRLQRKEEEGRGQASAEEKPRRKRWRDLTQEECKMWLN